MSNRAKKRAAARAAVASNRVTLGDGLQNVVSRLGADPGSGNKLSHGYYAQSGISQNWHMLDTMYRGSWITGAAVDVVGEDMVREGISISGSMPPDVAGRIQKEFVDLGLWDGIKETISWGRLYGGCIAIYGIEGQDLSTPLRMESIARGQFTGLTVVDKWNCQPSTEVIASGRDAGLPVYYRLNDGTMVHHSRVMRYTPGKLPQRQRLQTQGWSASVMERIYDRLLSFDSTTLGIANLVEKAHLRTVNMKGLREILAAGGDAEENIVKMFNIMGYLQSNEGITLLDADDQFSTHQYSFSGLSDVTLQFAQQISGATGIPLVRLYGQSPVGMNATGESDFRNYYDNIKRGQESDLRSGVTTLVKIVKRSLDGMPVPDDLAITFNPLWQMSDKEKAELANTTLDALNKAYDTGNITEAQYLQELQNLSEKTGIFSSVTDEDVEEARLQGPPMPTEAEPGLEPVANLASRIAEMLA